MQTRSTWSHRTTVCIALAELSKRGIRMVLHEFVDDLPPLGSTARGITISMGLQGITTRTAKTHAQLSNTTRADGKTLGQLTD